MPVFLASVVALGLTFLVGAFSAFDALLWRGTPYGPFDRYALLGEDPNPYSGSPMPSLRVDTYAAYHEGHERGRMPVFEGLIPFREREASLVVDGVATREVATWLLPDAYALL